MKLVVLTLTAVVPAGVWLYTRVYAPRHKWAATGAAFGFVAYPVSLGLLALAFLPMPLAAIGAIGYVLSTIHGLPGELVSSIMLPLFRVLDGPIAQTLGALMLFVLNGTLWGLVYWRLGALLDRAHDAKAGEGPGGTFPA
jgi:hypothetical protein